MSWTGGDDVFEAVVKELIATKASELVIARVTRALIEALTDRGWDGVDSSVAIFDHPGVLEAANDLGYYAYDQIPQAGHSTARIRCNGCLKRVHYYRDEDGDVHSDVHVTSEFDSRICLFSGKDPNGY